MESYTWDPVETVSQDEMAALQAERLSDCLARMAACVPFYREKLGAMGVAPEDVRSLDHLARLPFTVKQDLRDNYPYGLFAVPMDDVVRLHASSGTTGKMTVVGYTANDIAMWADLGARALSIGVVDPSTGESLPDGEIGELVFTCVTKEALPLLRYRTGDLTRLYRGECLCGRTTTRMDKTLGRVDDMLIIRGINVFPAQIETELLRTDGLEPHYELLLERGESHMDDLTVRVEASEKLYQDSDSAGAVGRKLAATLQSRLGVGCRVEVVAPKQMPRSEGKAVRIVDNRRI